MRRLVGSVAMDAWLPFRVLAELDAMPEGGLDGREIIPRGECAIVEDEADVDTELRIERDRRREVRVAARDRSQATGLRNEISDGDTGRRVVREDRDQKRGLSPGLRPDFAGDLTLEPHEVVIGEGVGESRMTGGRADRIFKATRPPFPSRKVL